MYRLRGSRAINQAWQQQYARVRVVVAAATIFARDTPARVARAFIYKYGLLTNKILTIYTRFWSRE